MLLNPTFRRFQDSGEALIRPNPGDLEEEAFSLRAFNSQKTADFRAGIAAEGDKGFLALLVEAQNRSNEFGRHIGRRTRRAKNTAPIYIDTRRHRSSLAAIRGGIVSGGDLHG
jgi:hypothetical protein